MDEKSLNTPLLLLEAVYSVVFCKRKSRIALNHNFSRDFAGPRWSPVKVVFAVLDLRVLSLYTWL